MNRKIIIQRLRNKRYTFQQIGDSLGISKQRVHQILTGYGRYNKRKEYLGKYAEKRGKIDSKFRLNRSTSTLIWKALTGKKAGRKWEKLVGYTINDLTKHLEKQFDDKMSWDNYGIYWWVDHAKPRSLFKFETAEDPEFRRCWALSNLQPMERIINIQKGNSYVEKT